MADVNPESRAIDEQMDRLTRREPRKLNVTELLKPPGSPLGAARQESSASSESQTVRLPRFWSPASYSAQFLTRYRDFAYLYWLRFGYFIGGDSGSGASHP